MIHLESRHCWFGLWQDKGKKVETGETERNEMIKQNVGRMGGCNPKANFKEEEAKVWRWFDTITPPGRPFSLHMGPNPNSSFQCY